MPLPAPGSSAIALRIRINPQFRKQRTMIPHQRQQIVVDRHIYALIDQNSPHQALKRLLHFGTALPPHGPLHGGGDRIGKPNRAGLSVKPAAPQQGQQGLPVNSPQLVFESCISAELVKGLQQPFFRPIFIPDGIE